jgi:RpiB/LacA/LacB family sugar-phosphate isomerase
MREGHRIMKIAIGGDNAGRPLSDIIFAHLKATGHEVVDLGKHVAAEGEYYAELADRVGSAILRGEFERGVLCCGTGIGVCISANKVPGIRAALAHDTYSAERAAKSNDAHILTMGARVIGPELAKAIVDKWLDSYFDPKGASVGNVEAIKELDAKYAKRAERI